MWLVEFNCDGEDVAETNIWEAQIGQCSPMPKYYAYAYLYPIQFQTIRAFLTQMSIDPVMRLDSYSYASALMLTAR